MIPQAFITEWSANAPWINPEQIEQDLIISRAIVEIFTDSFLRTQLAFRGGTAIHKLYLQPQPRYSEDIDLVQINAGPIKPIVQQLQHVLGFLGQASVSRTRINTALKFKVQSEIPPTVPIRLKIETNGREHFTVLGHSKFPYVVNSSWFTGSAEITTFQLEELLGTKMRALYQRSKGRDLFDPFQAIQMQENLDIETLIQCYHEYMNLDTAHPPSRRQYIEVLERKLQNPEFVSDTAGLLRPQINYDPYVAYQTVHDTIIQFL